MDTVLTRRRKDTSASDALGIDLRLPPVGKSGDVRKMETRLRSTGDLAAIRASRLWTELLPCVDGLINDADADPMAAIKVRAGLTADRKLGDATRALLAAAPMLRASLDGDGEWAELGGFAPSPDRRSGVRVRCAVGVGRDVCMRLARVGSDPRDANRRERGALHLGQHGTRREHGSGGVNARV